LKTDFYSPDKNTVDQYFKLLHGDMDSVFISLFSL